MTLKELTDGIRPADKKIYEKVMRNWDALAKPLGSLGVLERSIAKIAQVKETEDPDLERADLLVFCADNGVIIHGVSQSDEEVTKAVAKALGKGTSTVNYLASVGGCRVIPVDIGMMTGTPEGVIDMNIRRGSGDIASGLAMSREECENAILAGARAVGGSAIQGADIVLLGEMGIGNTTTAAAVTSVLLDRKPEETAGRGAGLSDEGLKKKIDVIRKALEVNIPDPGDPIDVISKVGGLDIAALCGACLGGAYYRIPVLLDGVITCAAALCALRLVPEASDVIIASHISSEPQAKMLLEALGLETMIDADLALGEGSGAVLALSLLRQAEAVYKSGHTFGKLGIEPYVPQ